MFETNIFQGVEKCSSERNLLFPLTEDRKFNPLQSFIYAIALYAGVPVLMLTGWGLLFPETVLREAFGVSGLLLTDLLDVITGFLLSIFLFVHIYLGKER